MTPAQEEAALRSCHPLYDAFCREEEYDEEPSEEEDVALIECDNCGWVWNEHELADYKWHCPKCKHKIGD